MSAITKPLSTILIDGYNVTRDVLLGSINHKANIIDIFSLELDNSTNKYDDFFDVELKTVEIWLGDVQLGVEKVFKGFVETPVPQKQNEEARYYISGLGTAECLTFQTVPETKAAYSAQTAAYIIKDIVDNYVELLLTGKILSSATTHNYDPKNKLPFTIIQDLATVDECFFIVTPYDRFIFDQVTNIPTLTILLDDRVIKSIRKTPDLSNIINYFTFRGNGITVTSEDAVSQAKYYKRAKSETDLNIADTTLAQAFADNVIATYKDPLWRYELEIVPVLGLSVNHKVLLSNEFFRVKEYIKLDSITRTFTQDSYSISLVLQNSPVPYTSTTFMTPSSMFSSYTADIRKLKQEVSVGWEKIADITLEAVATSITINSLDLATDKAYMLLFATKNAAAAANLNLYYNGDTTAGNYYRQYLSADGAGVGAARTNNALLRGLDSGEFFVCDMIIKRIPDGYPLALIRAACETPALIQLQNIVHVRNNTANVTSITLSISVADALSIGTQLQVFKIKS